MRRPAAALLVLAAACGSPSVNAPSAHPTPPSTASDAAPRPAADRVLRFDMIFGDTIAGGSVVTVHADGSRDATWEFNDRGRGPKQRARWTVAADGTPAQIDVTGVSYFKLPVDEHLALQSGKLVWSNSAEHGDAPAGGHAAYVANEGGPDLFAAVVRAALAAPEHRIPLLPVGELRVARAGDRTLSGAAGTAHVVRYELDGTDFAPSWIWLDDDGELFASVGPWGGILRSGWKDALKALVDDQQAADAARLGALAKQLGHAPPAAGLAIVHARLFDVEKKKVVPDATILVENGRIAAAGPGAAVHVPAGAQTLDAQGRTAIPGLWDMHTHVSRNDGLLYTACGVTTARDLANDVEDVAKTKRAWESGEEIGPRLLLAGFIDGRGPFQGPTKIFADDEAEGKRDIDLYASKGYEQIKLYSSLKPELVAPLAKYAHEKGLRVSGHVPNGMTAEQAVLAGYDEIQHENFLFLNFLAGKDDDTRTPVRFTLVAEKAASLDLASPAVKRFIDLLVAHHTVSDPTINLYETMFVARPGQIDPTYAAIADRLPPLVRRGLLGGGLPVPEGSDATYRASFEASKKLLKKLWDAGVTIVAGTDALAGFTLHRELEIYAEAGIPPADVIAIATIGAARVMKHDKESGSIAPGKVADVVLVDGKPDERVPDVRRVRTVVRGGVVYDEADLLGAISVAPQR